MAFLALPNSISASPNPTKEAYDACPDSLDGWGAGLKVRGLWGSAPQLSGEWGGRLMEGIEERGKR